LLLYFLITIISDILLVIFAIWFF